MKLYVFPVAPNPTRVRLQIAEKRAGGAEIPVEEVLVRLPRGEQRAPDHLARNPLGRLPVLEFDDGGFLTESLAIMEYLDETFPEPPTIGRTPRERARVRELDRIAEMGILLPVARIVHATRSPLGLPPDPAVAAAARLSLPEACALLDRLLGDGRPFLAGAQPTIADATLAAALQFARFGEVEIDPAFAELGRWDAAYRSRDVAAAVLSL